MQMLLFFSIIQKPNHASFIKCAYQCYQSKIRYTEHELVFFLKLFIRTEYLSIVCFEVVDFDLTQELASSETCIIK
jgi:hypothetical protein